MAKRELSIEGLNNAITSEDILGKNVIDSEGGFAGVVESVFMQILKVLNSGKIAHAKESEAAAKKKYDYAIQTELINA